MNLYLVPVDWDHQSYCVEPDCRQPATHRRLLAMDYDGAAIVEMICCVHAHCEDDEP